MSRLVMIAAGLVISIGAVAPVQAAAPMLNVKAGLWQTVSTLKMDAASAPAIPAETLAKLTPAQRAQVQAAMQGAMASAAKPHVSKSCVTEEELARGPNFKKDDPNCKQTILSHTATTLQIKEICTGKSPSIMTMSFKVQSQESVTGTIDAVMSDHGQNKSFSSNLQAKWLGSDCGKLAPNSEN